MGTIYTGLKSRDLPLPSSNPAQLVAGAALSLSENNSVTVLGGSATRAYSSELGLLG